MKNELKERLETMEYALNGNKATEEESYECQDGLNNLIIEHIKAEESLEHLIDLLSVVSERIGHLISEL